MTGAFGVPSVGGEALLGHLLLEDISDVVVVSDGAGRMTYVSPSLERILGFRPEEWVGQDGWPYVHPDDVPVIREQIVAALRSGDDVYRFTVAFRVRNAAGEWRNVEGRGTLRRQGERLSSMTVLRDVTDSLAEQRRLEQHLEQLRASKAWFESLVQHISDVIALMDSASVMQYVSPSVEPMLGWRPEELVGRAALDYVHPDDQAAVIAAIDLGNRDPDARRVPIAFRLRDITGGWRDVESLSTVLERDGDRVVRVLTVRDVTERKRSEADARVHEHRLRALAEVAPVAIALTDPAGAIEFANDHWRQLLGIEPSVTGFAAAQRAFDAVHPDDRDAMFAVWAGASVQGGAAHPFRVVAGDEVRWVRGRMRALTDVGGEVTGHVLSIEDVTDLVLAGEELRVNEERLRVVAEVAPVGIFRTEVDGRTVYANDRWREIFGVPPEVPLELCSELAQGAVHPDDVGEAEAQWKSSALRGDRFDWRYRIVRGAEVRCVHARTAPLHGPDGTVVGHVGSVEDVTELVAADDELREHRDRLRTIMAMAPIGIVQTDVDGVITYANDRWRSFYGIGDDEPVERYSELAMATMDSDELQAVMEHWAATAGQGGRAETVSRAVVGGEARWMRSRSAPLCDAAGRCIGHVGSVEDITETVLADTELRANQDRLRALAEMVPIGVFQTDVHDTITFTNDRWREFYGVAEAAGDDVDHTMAAAQAIHPDDRELMAATWSATARKGHPFSLQYRVLRDGETRWLRVRTSPLRGPVGELTGHVGSVEDVTDLVVANEELQASQQEAARANEAKSQFLSRMSHELRTPLNSIIGFGQLLSLRGFQGDDAEAVELILRGGRHLLDLINEVLDISRIEAGSLGLACEPVDVASVVRESVAAMRPQAVAHDVTLHADGEQLEGLAVEADRQRLLQVMLNLLSNAVKYNRPGGSVTVDAALQADGTVCVAVHDTGRGIAPELLDRLFQPFDRLGAEAWGIEGAGIGLTLSKALIDEMGGDLAVESVDGVGTSFSVKLPTARDDR